MKSFIRQLNYLDKMKNCLVIGGAYRTFSTTYEGIKKFAQKNDLDIFCHLWSNDHREISHVQEVLSPKSFIAEPQTDALIAKFCEIEDRIKKKNSKTFNIS